MTENTPGNIPCDTAPELDALIRENKRLTRELGLANLLIERNRVASAAQESMHQIISSQKSQLEQYMSLLLENCPDIILLFDRDGCLVYCTNAFLKRTGIPAFGIIKGEHYFEILKQYFPEDFHKVAIGAYEHIRECRTLVGFDMTADFGRTGDCKNYTVQLTPMVNGSGQLDGTMSFFHDTTDILSAKRDAERASAAKSDFLATVSHEIRTPMNAIIGLSDMLKATGLTSTQRGYLDKIRSSSHILLDLINDILDISKIEAGKLELLPEYFSLTEMLDGLCAVFDSMFVSKGLYFKQDFDSSLPAVVRGDEKRIRQVLTNILNNAMKYTDIGGVTFAAQYSEGCAVFTISDTGIGIREDELPRLFLMFEQIDVIRNKNIVGSGLGLAITKSLCDMMNGSIAVESEYGKGSRFTVSLPLIIGSKDALPLTDTANYSFSAAGAKVLLVDDIDLNLQVASFMLEAYDISPDFAVNGRQAVEKATAGRYDIILMDHMMPEMDGVEATRLIRQAGIVAPIVALTANATKEAATMFLNSGFNAFLAKPIDAAQLCRCLMQLLPPHLVMPRNTDACDSISE